MRGLCAAALHDTQPPRNHAAGARQPRARRVCSSHLPHPQVGGCLHCGWMRLPVRGQQRMRRATRSLATTFVPTVVNSIAHFKPVRSHLPHPAPQASSHVSSLATLKKKKLLGPHMPHFTPPLHPKPAPLRKALCPHRYADIIAHFNLKAALRGAAPPFGASDIAATAAAASATARELSRAEGDIEKYWAAEFFRQAGPEARWPALVLGWFRQESGLLAVSIEPLGLESIVRVDFPVSPGERLELAVAEVRVADGWYRFSVMGLLSGGEVEEGEATEEAQEGEDGQGHGQGGGQGDAEAMEVDAAVQPAGDAPACV